MVAGTGKYRLFACRVLHKVVAEISGETYCSYEQYQVGKIYRERRIFCDERHIVEGLPKKLLEQ